MSNKNLFTSVLVLALIAVIGSWIWSQSKNSLEPAAIVDLVPEEMGIILGSENASLTIKLYTNFTCPACASFAVDVFPKIEENYIKTGKAKMIFYLVGYEETVKAGYCANKLGKFADFHNQIFIHQKEMTEESMIFDLAKAAGLNEDDFKNCYLSDEAAKAGRGWIDKAQADNVSVTPTIFIGDQQFDGVKSYDEYEAAIEDILD